jgi:Tfp pilus assembly protein PilF
MRLAAPLVVAQDLSTSRTLIPAVVESDSDVYRAGAQEALRITIEGVAGSAKVDALLTDTATQRNVRAFAPTPVSASGFGLIGQLNALAKAIDEGAAEFSTRSEVALKPFSAGLSATDPQVKARRLREAIASDPSFGLAYVVLLQLLSSEHRDDADAILKSAERHRNSFVALDKARFDIVRGQLLRSPAEDQIRDAENFLKLAPNESDVLATLASALFQRGRVVDAERAIGRALVINPENPSLRQNLATGLFENRQFARAEQVLTGMPATPAILAQIAFCALLAGETKRADQIFDRFLKSVTNTNARSFLSASWQAYEGHLEAAIGQLEAAHFSDPQLTVLGRSQIVLWELMAKRYQDARAAAQGATPVATLLASGAPSAEAWLQKGDTAADVKSRDSLKGYGLYLYGFYGQSAEVWKKIDESAGGADLRARTMLAASLKMSGRADQAAKMPIQAFFPNFDDYYSALSFNVLRGLLGQAG